MGRRQGTRWTREARLALVCGLAVSTAALQTAWGQAGKANASGRTAVEDQLGITTLPLWPGTPPTTLPGTPEGTLPGAGAATGEASAASMAPAGGPTLTVFVPAAGRANSTAVIILPGGGYTHLALNLEGRQVADWFTARGITAFVLKYRFGKENLFPIPLLDARQALRVVRSLAPQYGYSPEHVGMVGFSAGGHLAATAGTTFDEGKPGAAGVEALGDRPDFLILGYPWLNAMQPNDRHLITYCSVLQVRDAAECAAWEKQYTPSLHVTAGTPPTFLYSTSDDKTVPVGASVDFYTALVAAGIPAEMHLFRHGGHGSGLGAGDPALDAWPALLEPWLRSMHLLDAGTTPAPGR